jgi:hypothetical protein
MQIDKLVSNHFETKGNPQMKRLMVFKISGKNRPQDASDKSHSLVHITVPHIPSKNLPLVWAEYIERKKIHLCRKINFKFRSCMFTQ